MVVLQAQSKEQKKAIEFLLNQSKIKYTTEYNRSDKVYNVNVPEQAKSVKGATYLSIILNEIKKSTVVRKIEGKQTKEYKAKTINKDFENKPVDKSKLEAVKISKGTFAIMHDKKTLSVVSEALVESELKLWANRVI